MGGQGIQPHVRQSFAIGKSNNVSIMWQMRIDEDMMEETGTYLSSSSSAVQNRQAQYILVVNAIAKVMHKPAVPALTKPKRAKRVVMSTTTAPRQSKLRSN